MRITDTRKLVCRLVATLFLAATAIGQTSSESWKCQAIGGFISTNVGGFGPNTTLGSVVGDLAGGIGGRNSQRNDRREWSRGRYCSLPLGNHDR